MRRQISIITVFISVGIAASTEAQLRKASDYFPLQVGNIWEYRELYGHVIHIEIEADTLLGDTLKIYRAVGRDIDDSSVPAGFLFYHYNKDSTVVFRDIEFPDAPYTGLPMIDTRHGLWGVWFFRTGDTIAALAITDTGSAFYYDKTRHWAEVSTLNLAKDSVITSGYYFRFVNGIGPVRQGEAPYSLLDTLVYARINGAEYGFPLSVENTPSLLFLPDNFQLRVFPNPLSASQEAMITIDLPSTQQIEVEIVNVLGQSVRALFHGKWPAGLHYLQWNGKDMQGNDLPQGLYFVVLKTRNIFKTQKLIYLH